jgi:hypothetical protein
MEQSKVFTDRRKNNPKTKFQEIYIRRINGFVIRKTNNFIVMLCLQHLSQLIISLLCIHNKRDI